MSTYGIDLGTTYSCIAKLDSNGNPEVFQNFVDGTNTLASAVYFEEDSNNTLYGEAAKEYFETSPDRLVQFAKREIGKPNGKTYPIDGKEYTPIEISALILKKLKQMAEEQGEVVEDVIITVPAYFGFEEREATRTAGKIAGLNVMDLIDEPTAAAVSYCYREFQEDQTVVVYDLGGGTFDISVLKMSVVKGENGEDINQIKQIASAGNDRLGGVDWDQKLYDIICDKYCAEIGMDASDLDAEARQSIRSKIEKIKKTLSSAESAKAKIKSDAGPVNIPVTREEFEEATAPLVAQTMTLLDEAMNKVADENVTKVLLVGGSTYMPMIRNAVDARFPGLVQIEDPDKAVAKGAAVYSSIIVDSNNETGTGSGKSTEGTNEGETHVTDGGPIIPQSPRSFGPAVFIGGEYMVDNLIIKGAELPASATKVYGTMADNQTKVKLAVFESMTEEAVVVPCQDPDGNPQDTKAEYLMKALGELVLELPPNTPKGTKIEVTFLIDAGGIHVSARNLETNESNSVKIEYATSMDEKEVAKAQQFLDRLSMED